MRSVFLLLVTVSCFTLVKAQQVNFAWVKPIAGQGESVSWGVVSDVTGNIYTTGYFTGTIDMDPGPGNLLFTSAGAEDGFLVKMDASGNLLWAKQLGGPGIDFGFSVCLDPSGNVLVTGAFSGTCNFNATGGGFTLTSVGLRDAFICKFSAWGTHIWTKQMGGNETDIGNSIKTDAAGNIISAGIFGSTADFDPGAAVYPITTVGNLSNYVLKLDNNGNFIWATTMGSDGEGGLAVDTDAAGNIYVTGAFSGSFDFDPGAGVFNMASTGMIDIFAAKLSSAGALVWAGHMGGAAVANGWDVEVSAGGNVYLTGDFAGTVDFDPGTSVYNVTSFGNYDIFVLKLNANGSLAWAKQMGSTGIEAGTSLVLDNAENVYTTGAYRKTGDFDPGVCQYLLTPVADNNNIDDIFISKLDLNGNFLWAKTMGGPNIDVGWSIDLGPGGSIITSGSFNQTVDFDPAAPVYNLTAVQSMDGFVHKLVPCTNSSSNTVNISTCTAYTVNCQTFTTSGTYTIYLVNSVGCDSILTINLSFGAIRGDSTTASACNSYNWQGQTLSSSGTYYDTLMSAGGCDSIVVLNLTVRQSFNQVVQDTICEGGSIDGHNSTGVYTDHFTTTSGCDSVRTLHLTVLPHPKPNLGPDLALCAGDTFVISPGTSGNYLWQDGSTDSIFIVSTPGIYNIIVSNSCGSGTDAITVSEGACDMWFPNAFTPDGDGKNDLFRMLGSADLRYFRLQVFNRWGELVYSTSDWHKGWDGSVKGKKQATGIFVWYCNFERNDGRKGTRKGTVMLMR